MAITYTASAALIKDATFIDRVKVAVLKFAEFILGEDPATSKHSARLAWAREVISLGSDTMAAKVVPWVVIDVQTQTDGGAITDSALQTALEVQLLKII